MTSFTSLLTGLVVIAGLVGLAVYFFGIPPEVKRKMENAALKTMGENKASFMLKDQISKMPEADQQDIKDLKSSLSNLAGGATRNRAGEKAGDLGDDLTKSFTGR